MAPYHEGCTVADAALGFNACCAADYSLLKNVPAVIRAANVIQAPFKHTLNANS